MKIKAQPNKTITAQLTDIVTSAFPQAINSGLAKDVGIIHNDPKSKGKAILFTWQKATLKLTENLKVQECDFTNTFVSSDLSMIAEDMINTHINATNVGQIPLDIPN